MRYERLLSVAAGNMVGMRVVMHSTHVIVRVVLVVVIVQGMKRRNNRDIKNFVGLLWVDHIKMRCTRWTANPTARLLVFNLVIGQRTMQSTLQQREPAKRRLIDTRQVDAFAFPRRFALDRIIERAEIVHRHLLHEFHIARTFQRDMKESLFFLAVSDGLGQILNGQIDPNLLRHINKAEIGELLITFVFGW